MKAKWERPELIVLEKGELQEMVLIHCKATAVSGLPQINPVGQNCGNSKGVTCQSCQARASVS